MREIIFRGKRKYTAALEEWYYGDLVHRKHEVLIERDRNDADEYFVVVDPDTVGEYTGLTDKNGKRIFEGDVLEGDLNDPLDVGATWKGIVTWGPFGWCTMNQYGSEPMDENDIKEGAVIGNIHDNPELKEV